MRHSNNQMLLFIAMADACAAAVEYVDRAEHPELFERVLRFEGYEQHPRHQGLRPGKYTDDTEMSISNARTLTLVRFNETYRGPPVPPTPDFLRDMYVNEFRNAGRRQGYSRGLQKILEECHDGSDLKRLVIPNSTKNGAAMRSVPSGVLELDKILAFSRMHAEITHATPVGIFSAMAVGLMSHFALHQRGPLADAPAWSAAELDCQLNGTFSGFLHTLREPWDGRAVKDYGEDLQVSLTTVWAVAHLLRTETSLMGMMRRLIEWGGDTDSVAAIAWGIASARMRDEVLPEFLVRELEVDRPDLGHERLVAIGTDLMRAHAY